MEKSAPAELPILDVIKRRWSPRAFADRPVEEHKLRCILEAARWSASSYNEQPWRWMLVKKADSQEAFDRAIDCLVEANQAWAKDAPVLLICFVKTDFEKNGKDNRVAEHDLGAAMAQLSLQATAMGLFVHQMAGVDLDKVAEVYGPPENFKPYTAAAVGYGGDPESLPEDWMREAEQADRTRKDRTELVFTETFGTPHPVMKLD
jgi:nitroreductase